MRRINNNSIIKLIAAVLLCIIFINGSDIINPQFMQNVKIYKIKDTKYVAAENAGTASYHIINPLKLQSVIKDGLTEMFFDPLTYSVSIKDYSTGKMWFSLPTADAGKGAASAAVLSLDVFKNGNHYYLNSQDNGVAVSGAKAEKIDGGMKVTYIIAENSKAVKKESQRLSSKKKNTANSDDNMAFTFVVTYKLVNGSFFASVDCSNIISRKNISLLSVNFLEYFGASDKNAKDGFMFVPDGSGALIDLGKTVNSFEPVNLKVYGEDASSEIYKYERKTDTAVIPAFGVKQGDNAFAAIIEDGDTVSSILADRSCGDSGYNKVFPKFRITSQASIENKKKSGYSYNYTAKTPYNGNIKICYRFLNGNNSDYSGMAVVCREQLIRDKVLSQSYSDNSTGNGTSDSTDNGSADTNTADDWLPLNLTVVGAEKDKTLKAGTIDNDVNVLTTFDQADDILEQMRAKGINNINMRYMGALRGEFNNKGLSDIKILSRLGGKKGYEKLYNYMDEQKLGLYLNINIFSDDSGSLNQSVSSITGNMTFIPTENLKFSQKKTLADFEYLTKPSLLESKMSTFIDKINGISMTGLCLNDAGKLIYSDFGGKYSGTEATKKAVVKQSESLKVGRKLMIDTGNIYMLKYADTVVNMPLSAKRDSSDESYVSIPFLQMVLHGMVSYSGSPINLSSSTTDYMLKSIEYGACPSFEWVYKDSSGKEKSKKSIYYNDWLKTAAEYYERANKTLVDLQQSRITNHYKVSDGVYCTVYDTNKLVYVNYNNKQVTVDGIDIAAKGWQRIG